MDSLTNDTQAKTPAEIAQELIAMHTTRKEACEKMIEKGVDAAIKTQLETTTQQSDQCISELMNELSNFGDAVPSEVNRENEYQSVWKKALGSIEALTSQELIDTFHSMEESLKKNYTDFLETKTELPGSFRDMLTKQLQKLC